MRINLTHSYAVRQNDCYWTPACAVQALLRIEGTALPRSLTDPCCGAGAILDVLKAAGHIVHGADIIDHGWPHTVIRDYLAEPVVMNGVGIVTNPPYRLALRFIQKALRDET
jgi:hypothetical protein